MSESRKGNLLFRYAARKLSPEEEDELMRLAYDDQEVFNALSREHVLRELLDDKDCRRILTASAPRAEPAYKRWLATLLSSSRGAVWPRAAVWATAGAPAIVILAILVLYRHQPGPAGAGELLMSSESRAQIAEMLALPPAGHATLGTPSAPQLELRFPSGTDFPMNGRLDLEFTTSRGAALLLIEFVPGAPGRILFPSAGGTATLQPGATGRVPPGSAVIQGIAGPRRLALLAFPPGTDLAACLRGIAPWPMPYAVAQATFTVRQ